MKFIVSTVAALCLTTLCATTMLAQRTNSRTAKKAAIMVWTELSQQEVQRLLPHGATVTASGKNGYQVNGVTAGDGAFAIALTQAAAAKTLPIPRFGKVGHGDPGGPTEEQLAFARQFGALLLAAIHDNDNLAIDNDFPAPGKVLLNPVALRARLNKVGQGPGGPFVGPGGGNKKGKWVRVYEPEEPCARPEEPVMEDVPDCAEEEREVNRVMDRLRSLEAYINSARVALAALEAKDAVDDAADYIILTFTVFAIVTSPIGIVATIPIVVTGYVIKGAKDVVMDVVIDGALDWAGYSKADIAAAMAEAERRYGLYFKGLQDALRDLRNCKLAAATAEALNAEAFDNFVNVDLPAYYACLDARKCYFKWVPK